MAEEQNQRITEAIKMRGQLSYVYNYLSEPFEITELSEFEFHRHVHSVTELFMQEEYYLGTKSLEQVRRRFVDFCQTQFKNRSKN